MTKIILSSFTITCLIFVFFLIKQGNYGIIPFFLWFIAILTTFFIFPSIKTTPKKKSKNQYFGAVILTIITLYSLRGLLFVNLSNIFFHGDEGIISRNAQNNFINAINQEKWNLLGSENGTINKLPSLWYFIQGFIVHIFGKNIFVIKLFSFVSDFIICIIGYLLVKDHWGDRPGLFFVLIYSTFPISIHFSLTGYQNIQSTLFLIASIYCFLKYCNIHNYRLSGIFFAGVLCALSFYFYLSSLVVPIILVLSIFIISLANNVSPKKLISTFLVFLVGVLEGLIPYLVYSFFHYSFIFGRKEAFLSFGPHGDIFTLLLSQIKAYLSGFLPTGSMSGSGLFYINLPGFCSWLLLSIFVIGVTYICFKRDILGIISIITIFITSIFGGILTVDPPAPQRLIHIFPFIIIISCLGVKFITKIIGKILPFLDSKIVSLFLVITLVISNIFSFFRLNLPTYHKFFNIDVSEITHLMIENKKPLYFNAPIHKLDQVYYYSGGTIDPIIVNSCDQLGKHTRPVEEAYLMIDKNGFDVLSKCDFVKTIVLKKDYTTVFGHTYLYQFVF